MAPPTPSHYDAMGPIFVKSDLAHSKKRKFDGTSSVSIKGVPVGSQLQVEGPGSNNEPVLFKCTEGKKEKPVQFDCYFRREFKKIHKDGIMEIYHGEKCTTVVCGTYSICNYQSLHNHAQKHWGSSTTQKLTTDKRTRKIEFFIVKKKKPNAPMGATSREGSAEGPGAAGNNVSGMGAEAAEELVNDALGMDATYAELKR